MVAAKTRVRRQAFKRLPKGANGGIELLLIQNVDSVGKQGDVVEVRAGHANNFLLPQGLAIVATEHHKRMVEKHKAKLKEIEKKRLGGLQTLSDKIAQQSITIEANANDEGHLYGSVGAARNRGRPQGQRHRRHRRSSATARTTQGTRPLHGQGSPAPRDRMRSEGLGRADS